MNRIITSVFDNIGMSFEDAILFVVVLGCMIMMAKDVKLGSIFLFVLTGLLFMWYYTLGLDYTKALTTMVIGLIFMSFTLFAVAKAESRGYIP